jgi:hypothetical protein
VIGGFVQDKRLRTRYEELAEAEINQMREHFRARTVAREEKPPLEELKGVVEEAGYSTPSKAKQDPVVYIEEPVEGKFEDLPLESRNVFRDQEAVEVQGDGWDYETELARREGATGPYIIHEDERSELDFSETEFTYYDGDDVVCDAENRIISKPEDILGVDFRKRFGHGSNDPNVVFIRNGMVGADIEVSRMPGMHYAVEVQGMDGPEQDEYDDPRPRSTKFDDDD